MAAHDVDRVVARLASEHAHERNEAKAWLSAHPHDSLPALRTLVRTGRPDQQTLNALPVLGRIGDESDVALLEPLLGHESSSLVWAVAAALAALRAERARHALERALWHRSDDTAGAAAVALGSGGHESSRRPLEALLNHPSEGVRYRAVFALDKLGAAPSRAVLTDRLRREESTDVRRLIEETLQR